MPKIFLAGACTFKSTLMNKAVSHYLLDSFYFLKSRTAKVDEYMQWSTTADDFLLDSGAFTFMNKSNQSHKNIDLDDYIQKYIDIFWKFYII